MTLEPINLSTGPVAVSLKVQQAFQEPPISHRSIAFKDLYEKTTQLLNEAFGVQRTFLLSGSGTLANEAMIQEIKCIEGQGLILSNGEFGNRLINQARRNQLFFETYQLPWGEIFNREEIERLIVKHSLKWILFCHCETSTGVVNDLKHIADVAGWNSCLCFADCMSTVGTEPLNLSEIAMATASSGKGLASIPGLAIVFSNINTIPKKETPIYLDLNHYYTHGGIPFTISSNLVKALYTSVCQKLHREQYELIKFYRRQFFDCLNEHQLVPFNNRNTSVFTIAGNYSTTNSLVTDMIRRSIILSYESDYLKNRKWCQLATFGYYADDQLKRALYCLKSAAS